MSAFLPGRTVDLLSTAAPSRRGVVIEVGHTDRYVIHWDTGGTSHVDGDLLRAVNPDRPTLAHDDLYAVTLGEALAMRSGPDDLARFHDGYNNGHTAYKEAARDILRKLDERAAKAKNAGCFYTYVVDLDGKRRPGRRDYVDGDTLITCPWFVDGPDRTFCGPHQAAEERGERSSIFYPSDDGPWRPEVPVSALAATEAGEPS